MKRRMAAVLFLSIMLMSGIVSCNKKENSAGNIRYATRYGAVSVAEDGIFYVEDDLVHFVSSDTHENVIFCTDLVCEHEPASKMNPDPECRAALFVGRTDIAYYEGYIYYFVQKDYSGHEVYRMNVSSGGRELVGTYPYGYTDMNVIFHEDCMYYNAKIYEEQETSSTLIQHGVLLEVNINDGGYRVIADTAERSSYAVSSYDVCGNILYGVIKAETDYFAKINLETLEETVLYEISLEESKLYRGIYDENSYYYIEKDKVIGIHNTVTGEEKIIIEAEEGETIFCAAVTNNRFLYSVSTSADDVKKYFYDASTGKRWNVTGSFDEYGTRFYDGYSDRFIVSILGEVDGDERIIGFDSIEAKEVLGS